jgi:DNA-binding transcriptional LysR family regulator
MIEPLRHFLLIAEHATYTRAARHAHLSQPALTASIRRLEETLDARLFDRGRHGATLTEAGRALLPHARAAVVAIDEGRRAVTALEQLEAGEVRLGGGSTACTYLLPPVLSAFRKKHPKVIVRLRELPENLASEAFDAGELDLVVANAEDRGELFRDETVVLVAPPGVDPASLPFVTFTPGSAVRGMLDRHFPEAVIAMELASISTVKGSVRAGLGVALITRTAVATDLALGRLVEVRDPRTPLPRPLHLISRGVERLSPAARALRVMLLRDAPRRRKKRGP